MTDSHRFLRIGLVSSGLPVEAGFLPGLSPFAIGSSFAGITLGSRSFRGVPQATDHPWGTSMKIAHPRFRPSSFQSVPETPFYSRLRAARVRMFSAVASLASGKEPFAIPPPIHFGTGFFIALPFSDLSQGGGSLASRFQAADSPSSLSGQPIFVALQPRGIIFIPLTWI